MSDLPTIRQARFESLQARRQLASTLGTLKYRLKPGNLASSAWEDMREKGGEIAGGAVDAAKAQPAVVGGIAAAVALFLARKPLANAARQVLDGNNAGHDDVFIEDWDSSPVGVPVPISEGATR